MTVTTTIDSITTEDAAPTAAPHRISNKAGKDHADLTFTPTDDGYWYPSENLYPDAGGGLPYGVPFTVGAPGSGGGLFPTQRAPAAITKVRIVEGGVDAETGTIVEETDLGAGVASGTQLSASVTYAETGAPADGPQTINVWVWLAGQGWQ